MATFPPELVEIIVHEIWHSTMPSIIRQSFMTTCPRINRTWKAVYAPIASQDIYIPSLAYIYYLCDIAGRQKSIIYHDFIPRLTRTITCFVDLRRNVEESAAAKEVYALLMWLPNDVGLRALFPQVPYISFELNWIGDGRMEEIRGLPILIRYDRYLSPCCNNAGEDGYLRLDVHIFILDLDPSSSLRSCHWRLILLALHNVGLKFPRTFSGCDNSYYQRMSCGRILYLYQTKFLPELQGDTGDINRCLWMASKRPHGLRLLAAPRFYWKYKQSQWSLPVAYSYYYRIVGRGSRITIGM
ncbi:uncharacterized protein EV420DRAFT_1575036 [Desarmillaria tabescens]|uniref:Uncharacterized protein n=1 Tax=Armillaria tabescens TaxID=1929756 RepID=A0AA39JM54_ARMTA|nr:uncharacterized protein EV420DRAFT_1575036 [Desarmillaria tabescens]KAK0444266.1 hypothetical protein EV420DRAFT_1575036 [Desarmillaria tabescens]